jgi:hypothetical protein
MLAARREPALWPDQIPLHRLPAQWDARHLVHLSALQLVDFQAQRSRRLAKGWRRLEGVLNTSKEVAVESEGGTGSPLAASAVRSTCADVGESLGQGTFIAIPSTRPLLLIASF